MQTRKNASLTPLAEIRMPAPPKWQPKTDKRLLDVTAEESDDNAAPTGANYRQQPPKSQDECNNGLVIDSNGGGRRLSLADPVYIPGYCDRLNSESATDAPAAVDFSSALSGRRRQPKDSSQKPPYGAAPFIMDTTGIENMLPPMSNEYCSSASPKAAEENDDIGADGARGGMAAPIRRSLTNDELLNMVRDYIRDTKPSTAGTLDGSDTLTGASHGKYDYDDAASEPSLSATSVNRMMPPPAPLTASLKFRSGIGKSRAPLQSRSHERHAQGEHFNRRDDVKGAYSSAAESKKYHGGEGTRDALRMSLRRPPPLPDVEVTSCDNASMEGVSAREKRLRYMPSKHLHVEDKYKVKKCDLEIGKPPQRSAARMRLTMANPCQKTNRRKRPCRPPKHFVRLNKTATLRFRTQKYCGRSVHVSVMGGGSVSRNDSTYKEELMRALQEKREGEKSQMAPDKEGRPRRKKAHDEEKVCGVEKCRPWVLRDDEPLVGNECALANKKCLERKRTATTRPPPTTMAPPDIQMGHQMQSLVAVVVTATSADAEREDAAAVALSNEDAHKNAVARLHNLESKFKEFVVNKCTIPTTGCAAV